MEIKQESIHQEINLKNTQIKNLQNKLDSQDLLIKDYYSLKNKLSEANLEITNLKKILEKYNSQLPSLQVELTTKLKENEKLKTDNNKLSHDFEELKIKSDFIMAYQSKKDSEIKEYKKHESLLKNLQDENEILNKKISTLNDIEEKSEQVIYDLKNKINKLNLEKQNLLEQLKLKDEKVTLEAEKNKELLEANKVLVEDKKKLNDQNANLISELNETKNNMNILNKQNMDKSEELNKKSYNLSEVKIRNDELEKEINQYKEKIKNVNIINQNENEKNKNLEKSLDEMKNQMLSYKEKNIELKNSILTTAHNTIDVNKNKNNNKDVISMYENEIKQLMEKNTKLLKKNEKYKANINLFLQENKAANQHIQIITKEINDIKNKNISLERIKLELEKKNRNITEENEALKFQNVNESVSKNIFDSINEKYKLGMKETKKVIEINKNKEKYIKDMKNIIYEYENEIEKYKAQITKLNVKIQMINEKNMKLNEKLSDYQKMMESEKNKFKNSESTIMRLRAELDYVNDKNLNENKTLKTEIINLNKKLVELNEKLNYLSKVGNARDSFNDFKFNNKSQKNKIIKVNGTKSHENKMHNLSFSNSINVGKYIDNYNDINNKINFRNNKKYSFTNANSRTNINIKRGYFDYNLPNNNSEKVFYTNRISNSCNLNIDNDEDINFKLISKTNNNIDNIVEEKNEKDFNSDIKLPEPNKSNNNENKEGKEKEEKEEEEEEGYIKEEQNNNNNDNNNDKNNDNNNNNNNNNDNDNNINDNNINDNNLNNGEKDSDTVRKSDSIRKCLFDSIKTQDENEMILTQNINNSIQIQEIQEKNYVKFENIRIVLISNYGHKDYVGLTGLEFIDNKGKVINIEKAKTIGALPKDFQLYIMRKKKREFLKMYLMEIKYN